MKQKQNLLHIDELRFLVIHLVLINHWCINLYLTNSPYDHNIFNFFFDLTSPCLAMMSGYLFFYKTKEKFNYFRKLKTRFHSIVVPYVFWSLSFFLIYHVVKEIYSRMFHTTFWYAPEADLSIKNVFLTLLHPPLANFWYLLNLVFILPFNFIIYYLLRNRYVYLLVFLAVLACYSFDLADLWFNSRFLPYYMIGCFFGYNEKYLPRIPVSRLGAIVLIPVLVFVGVSTAQWKDNVFPLLEIRILIAVFFLISVYNLLDSNQKSLTFKYLEKYKPYSFFLFAINMFLFAFVQRVLLKLGTERFLHYDVILVLFLLVSLVLVLILAYLIGGQIKKRFSQFYFLITGRG
jgi:hypothetical protein